MKEFSSKVIETPTQIEVELSGFFDENSRLPSLGTQKSILIRFKEMALMNSYGIKLWCKWADEHKSVPLIQLEACPFVFTRNFSSIRGFLAPNMKVISFYVPFYSEESSETREVLLKYGKDYASDGAIKLPQVLDSQGSPMELDVNASTYFQFLKK